MAKSQLELEPVGATLPAADTECIYTYGFVLGCGFGVEMVGVGTDVDDVITAPSPNDMPLCVEAFGEGIVARMDDVPQAIVVVTADGEDEDEDEDDERVGGVCCFADGGEMAELVVDVCGSARRWPDGSPTIAKR